MIQIALTLLLAFLGVGFASAQTPTSVMTGYAATSGPHAVLWIARKDNQDTVQRFVRAYTEAIAIYKNNRDLAMKVTSKYTGIKDPAILASTVDFYAPKLQRVPYPTVGGLRFVLEQVALREPKAKNYAPETFMDTRFVKQLEDSGFIKGLYPKG
jgi:hypothetical protein